MLKFKKLNNKGVTLVELIVSFALVAVAIIYFYQTLTTVTKMYANARSDINHATNVNYAFRLIDAAYEQGNDLSSNWPTALIGIAEFSSQDEENGFDSITFTVDEEDYILYKFSPEVIDEE